MEDSGYYSHKSGDFKLFSSASSENSYRRRLFSRELLSLSYEQFKNSEKFHHLVSGFRDEHDFEEFKEDLRDFWRLKESTCEEFQQNNSPTPEHMLMEFFNSDENFKEFERVFDDFKYHRFYDFDDLKKRRSRGDPLLTDNGPGSQDDDPRDDTFSEFFDNDEDFQEFEQEFANFKVKQRRSRALDDFNRRSWCDLRSDINSASDKRKGQTASGNKKNNSNKADGFPDSFPDKKLPETSQASSGSKRDQEDDCREFRRQTSGEESQYYTCREFPTSPGGNSRDSGANYCFSSPPEHDPPSYDFVMQNRKPHPNTKSHSCDYADLPNRDSNCDTSWAPPTHFRSQSYDFSQGSNYEPFHAEADPRPGSDFRPPSSYSSRQSDSYTNRSYQPDSHNLSGSNYKKSQDKFQTSANSCNRSQSYDFSEKASNASKKFDAKSHSFDSTGSSYKYDDSKSTEFSRRESSDFSENVTEEKATNKGHSKARSSTLSSDSKYEYSDGDRKTSEILRNQSCDFSENSTNKKSNKKSNVQSRNQVYENVQEESNGGGLKSSSRHSSRSESADFTEVSEKLAKDRKSSKVTTKNETANASKESKCHVNDLGQKSKSTSKSKSFDFSKSSKKFKESDLGSKLNRNSYDENAYRERMPYSDSRKYGTTGSSQRKDFDNVFESSSSDSSDKGQKSQQEVYVDGSKLDSPSSSDPDFFDCSDEKFTSSEDLFREIYHGCSDFSGYDHRKYPGARRLVSNLPTLYSRHSSDSELDMGGTYPNIRLDRIPVNEGLKRRSAEYYHDGDDTLGDNIPYVRAARDYGRRSNSDHSVYIPRSASRFKSYTPSSNDCQYTCHHRCRPLVTLDCATVSGENGEAGKPDEERPVMETCPNCQSCQSDIHSPSDQSQNDDTDSGYRSGGITGRHRSNSRSRLKHDPDAERREEIRVLIDRYNEESPSSLFCFIGDSLSFQGFIRVTLNLIRPITMSLGARPPSIYEILTKEHIVEQNTMSISFYMPRDTIKQIHVTSDSTTKEVLTALLKKFKILDHPRKFALYAQELKNGKLVKLWRILDKDYPLKVCLNWGSEDLKKHRLVLQENETGEIEWNAFSEPELNNFMRILDKEEEECTLQLQYKYKVMKRIIQQRMKEIRKERKEQQSQRS